VDVLTDRFLFAYDCYLVNCAHHTRRTARQRLILTRLKSSREAYAAEGRLSSGIGLLASLGGCSMLAMIVERRDSIGAHALVLHDLEMPISEHQSRNARGRSSIDG
jgi:hypothetical protein